MAKSTSKTTAAKKTTGKVVKKAAKLAGKLAGKLADKLAKPAKPAAKSAKTAKPAAKPAKPAATTVKKSTAKKSEKIKSDKAKIEKVKAEKPDTKYSEKVSEKNSTMAKKNVKKSADLPKEPQEVQMSPAEARAKAMKSIKGYSQEDLDHFKKIILEKRDEIIEQLQNLRDQMMDPTTREYINENSPYSLHMAEQGTDAMEREKTFLYAQRENKFLGYLEDALKRIDAGTYGICIECIEEPQNLCETCPLVPKARLEAVPHSQLCLPIKQRQEKR
jgi:DnaK suppressor protein